jgi:FixJ family two-component response regulator
VILDFEMPGIDGFEPQRRLDATGMPVVFITGHDDPAVRKKALALGAIAYLKTPFNNAVLTRAVETALGHANFHKALRPAAAECPVQGLIQPYMRKTRPSEEG